MYKKLIILILMTVVVSNCYSQNDLPYVNDLYIATNSIIAHRGAWKKNNYPDNSIASLKEAIRLKCKGSEFDMQLTLDDSVVVFHDIYFKGLNVEKSKYSDLKTTKLANGENLPTLRDYILFAKYTNTTTQLFGEFKTYSLSSERKVVFVSKVLEEVNKLQAQDLIVYSCFDYGLLQQLLEKDARVVTQYLGGNVTPIQLRLDKIAEASYSPSVYFNNLNWIQSAKNNKVKLNVWTVNSAANITWFLKNNFDGIVTDEPELALDFLSTLDQNDFFNLKFNLKVFPNPTSNIIWVQADSLLINNLNLKLINEEGKTMLNKTFPQGSRIVSIDTELLSDGIYFIRITDEEHFKMFKIIVNR